METLFLIYIFSVIFSFVVLFRVYWLSKTVYNFSTKGKIWTLVIIPLTPILNVIMSLFILKDEFIDTFL